MANGTHTIVATAYDASGLSGSSSQVTVTINNGTDTRPPVITHLSATALGTTAVITWNTDEPATAQVEYGTSPTPPNTSSSAPNLNLLTTHSITLTNLSPSTTYYARVFDRDAATNLAYSGNISFVTSTTGNAPPQITLGSPTSGAVWPANTVQSITWMAHDDVAVTGINLYYSTDYGNNWNLIAANLANTGSYPWTVPNISSTTVRVRAVAFDGTGASGEDSSNGDFTIIPSNPAPQTPVLNGIVPDGSAYTVSWSAVTGATNYILEEDASAAFTNPTRYSLSETSKFFYNQLPATYFFRVRATNTYGPSTPSSTQSVILNYDLGPGTINAVTPSDGASAQALSENLIWSALNPGGQALKYTVYVAMSNTDSFFPSSIRASDQTANSLAVSNLPWNTTISWGVRAVDASGLVTWSQMFHFTTVGDTTPPTGSISINNGAATTDTYGVTLFVNATDAGSGAQAERFSNDRTSWTGWQYLAPQVQWNLANNNYGGRTGLTTYTVYAQFLDAQGNISPVYSDSINKVTGKPGNITLNGRIYATIQEAINVAQPGDTVCLSEGSYSVTGDTSPLRPWDANRVVGIVMRPGVTLRGAGADKTIISFDQSFYGLVDSDNAVIEGITLVNSSFPGSTVSAVLLESNSSVVRNCTMRASFAGIYVGYDTATGHPPTNNVISDNTIVSNSEGIQVSPDASNISIFNNTIAYDTGGGGITCFVSSVTITNNIIAFNAWNIGAVDGIVPIIQSNDVYLAAGSNYSNIPDQTGINGNLSADPLFNNVGSGDYHLTSSSPAIDRGINVGIPFAGSAPDLGALESNATGTVQVTSNRSDAAFTVVGPLGIFTGSGTAWSMGNLPIGVYTITFKPLSNVYMPPYQAQSLFAGQTLSFDGTYKADTVPPTCTLVIDNSEYVTTGSMVSLALDATDEIAGMGNGAVMKFSNDGTTWSTAEGYATVKVGWDLTAFGGTAVPGLKTVYAMVSDALGNWATFTDTILYAPDRLTLEVPTQYASIQAALDAAQAGDIVHVGPGNYGNVIFRNGVTLQGSGPDVTVLANVTTAPNSKIEGFRLNSITASQGPTIIADNTFHGVYPWSVQVGSGVQAFVRNNIFNNFLNGGGLWVFSDSTSVTAENNTFVNCSAGPAVLLNQAGPNTKVILRDNIFAFNDSGVVDHAPVDTARQHVFTFFNTFWNNTNGNFGESETTLTTTNLGQGMSSGDVNADPLFVDPSHGNFQTQAASPALNSGDPNPRFNDPDGTQDDRGAYGGPGAIFSPVAAFKAVPGNGSVGSIFTFDASTSFDPTGGGLLARWDFNGDGAWDTPFSPLLVVSQRMDVMGTFPVKLEVQNQSGQQADFSSQVVVQNQNPDTPRSPSPSDASINVSQNPVLGWQGWDPDPLDTVSYDVYFGSTTQPALISTGQPEATFAPASLLPATFYYWRIVAQDNHGATATGPLWSFMTVPKSSPTLTGTDPALITYGTATTTISGHLDSNGGQQPMPAGETVQVTLNNVTQDAILDSNGGFSTTFGTGTLGVGGSPYPINFTFAGDDNFTATIAQGSLAVRMATPNKLVFTSNPQTVISGNPSGTITVQLEDWAGNLAYAPSGGIIVKLSTTFSTTQNGGSFLDTSSQPLPDATINIPEGAGTASFEYEDSSTGSPTVLVASAGLASAEQQETVYPAGLTFQANGSNITARAGTAFSGTVATFNVTDNTVVASSFTANITWGDGHTSSGTVIGSSGNFTITGSNTYGREGSYPLSISITETNGNTGAGFSLAHVARTTPVPGTLVQVANTLSHSQEYYRNLITAIYQKYLGRGPDPGGLAAWVAAMQNGLSDERLEAGFISSAEFIRDNGGLGAGWITSMYEKLLSRDPDQAGLDAWKKALDQGVRPNVIALGFAASLEREAQRITADYWTFLGRPPETTAVVNFWVNAFEHGLSNEGVVGGFVGSREDFLASFDNAVDWVYDAYRSILDRAPEAAGLAAWVRVLGS